MILSVVIPTRNEARNIVACLDSFLPMLREGWGEVLVVDNASTDGTAQVCRQWAEGTGQKTCAALRVMEQGPERSAQRNRGWREARGEFVFFVDADMRISEAVLREIRGLLCVTVDALYVREIRMGDGAWTRVRNFERSFYDATCIDALRVIRRSVMERLGGYDEALTGPEDWDMDRRILQETERVALTHGALLHDERRLTFRQMLRKKAYYSAAFARYQAKWHHDAMIRKQFGFAYRFFGVFFEKGKWRRVVRHPFLMVAVWAEKVCVGMVYLWKK